MCPCAAIATLVPCVSPCDARIGLAGRRTGGSRGSRSGRFAWDCLCSISNLNPVVKYAKWKRVVKFATGGALTVQLVPIQMLCPRVALPTSLMRTFELLVEPLPAPPSLPRTLAVALAIARVAILFPVASPPTVLTAIGRCGGRRLTCTNRGVHLVSELRLNLA
jgi:hypothetical protein